jgi:hypothetical protein
VPTPQTLQHGDRPKGATHYSKPLAVWDVYIDDFPGLVQGGSRTRRRVKQDLIHTLETVLRPLDDADSYHRQEPDSLKKMANGESALSTVKVILGWVVDPMANTISLPAHRLTRFRDILASIGPTQRRISLKKWQQVLGELCSMALAIPAAIGLFSVLKEALKANDGHQVRLTRHTDDFMQDFCWLVDDVGARHTSIDELLPDHTPSTHGECDASKKV